MGWKLSRAFAQWSIGNRMCIIYVMMAFAIHVVFGNMDGYSLVESVGNIASRLIEGRIVMQEVSNRMRRNL